MGAGPVESEALRRAKQRAKDAEATGRNFGSNEASRAAYDNKSHIKGGGQEQARQQELEAKRTKDAEVEEVLAEAEAILADEPADSEETNPED